MQSVFPPRGKHLVAVQQNQDMKLPTQCLYGEILPHDIATGIYISLFSWISSQP